MKKSFLLAGFIAGLTLVPCVKAEELHENKILDSATEISTTYVIPSSGDITIDLKGQKLTGPDNGYAIDNQGGKLKIIDTVGGGEIICKSATASCIRNKSGAESELTISGDIKISSPFITVKNESNATLKVEKATITASGTTGTIVNYGEATIIDSHIIATGEQGKAIYSIGQTVGNPTTTIENSIIEAKGADAYAFKIIQSEEEDASSSVMHVTVNNGAIIGKYLEENGADIKVSGKVEGPIETLKYMTEATLVLNEDATVDEGLTITNDKTINLDLNGYKITGDIKNEGTLTLEDSSESKTGTVIGKISNAGDLTVNGGNYEALPVSEGEGSNIILNGGTYPEEAIKGATLPEGKEFKKNEDGTYSIVDKVVAKEEAKNPDTSDTVLYSVIAIAIAGLGLTLTFKKAMN